MLPTRRALIWVLPLLLVGACSAAPTDSTPAVSTPASSGPESAAGTGYPLTVDNCGTEVTIERPPNRIVTIKSTSTELVLALGLGEKLVGTAFSDGPLPEHLADGAVPVLAERAPSEEVVLETEPDLIYAGWESNFAADSAGERTDLHQLGVATYVSPAACMGERYQPNPLTFEDVFDGITEAGAVLGASESAADLVSEQRAELATITPSAAGLSAVWYSSGSDTPFVGGGIGAPALLMETAGLENIMGTAEETWMSASWEAVAEQNPDVIVLVDSAWNTAEHKKEVLESNPITAVLPAVVNEQYVTVPFPASEAGVRSVSAAADIAAQVTALESGT